MEAIKNISMFSESPVAHCLARSGQMYYPDKQGEESCPDCGTHLIRLGYCMSCPLCGFGSCG